MKKQNKLYRNIISFILLIVIVVSNFNISFATPNTIYIDTPDDWIKFSKDASLDTYFQQKTVLLRGDLDFSSIEFSSIETFQVPTFGGIFDGQGHTISGVSINESGSTQGLFRYLQEDGVIKNLKILGSVTPSGSQSIVGGLVGNNKGSIEHCHFNGKVSGKNNIGGLAGINEVTGTISNCSSEGIVIGDHFTGGIVGQNLGTILKSTNLAKVNTTISETTVSLERVNWSQINSTENVSAHTDTGGITGFSSGYIQDCINKGPIGYTYMGYNVGGIVGRQSGYLYNCENYHMVLGRKDVGGIVGQIEPHLILLFSEDTLQKINKELTVLQSILNNSFSHTKNSSEAISSGLTGIGETIDQTRDITQVLSRGTGDYVDEVTDTVNLTSRRVRYTLEEIIPILDEAKEISNYLNEGLNDIESGFDHLEITSSKMADALDQSQEGMKNLRKAIISGEEALYKTERGLRNLLNAIEKQQNTKNIIQEIDHNITSLGKSFRDAKQLIDKILGTLELVELEAIKLEKVEVVDLGLSRIRPKFGHIGSALDKVAGTLESASQNISKTAGNLNKDLRDIFYDLEESFTKLNESIDDFQVTFSKLEGTSKQSGKAFSAFSDGFSKFGESSESMTTMVVSIKDLIDSLVLEPNIELSNISSEYRQSGEELFDTLGDMSSKVKDLHEEIKSSKDNVMTDMEAASNQIIVIFNLLIASREDIGGTEYIEDISDEKTETAKLGVVYKNKNYGLVSGASNIGGIVGSMAIEYDLDPEDDILKTGTQSLNFKYLTTAVVKECINNGKITAKKDYTGGIAGRMDIGIITRCENYGDIESKEGDYVGGIAGYSNKNIDKSFALSTLSGKNYIGGIVGYGNNISNSYTLIDFIKGTECIGTIAGKAEGEIANNYYVHDTIAAIDGISYKGKASPLSYEKLLEVEMLPEAFRKFHLTFIAEGNIIKKIPFNYGDSFDLSLLPQVPPKDEHDYQWEDFNAENMIFSRTIEAVYTPLRTVLSSDFMRVDESLPLFLAEGNFGKDVKLKVSPADRDAKKNETSADKIVETWKVELEGGEDQDVNSTLRFLMPETKTKLKLWRLTDNRWEKIESSINGSYMVFAMKGDSEIVRITEKDFAGMILKDVFYIAMIAILVILLFFSKRKVSTFLFKHNVRE